MHHKSRMGGGSRMYNLRRHTLHENGLLTIKASGYDGNEHWTGWLTIAPEEADYKFWHWLVCVKQVPGIATENELDAWKREYAVSQTELAEVALVR